jgi:hypothetical protein
VGDVVLKKIDPGSRRTAYAVHRGRRLVGYVWSVVGFSYRGTQGWNRGVRLRDYHPVEWRYGLAMGLRGLSAHNRGWAVRMLLEAEGRHA